MTLTNAPAIITQLSTQLAACAAWSGSTGNHWYPSVTYAAATLPLAVLDESSRSYSSYAAGAGGLASGTLRISIHVAQSSDVGTLETLARTLLGQLLAQDPGILFRSGECGLCGEASTAEIATDTATYSIDISLPYGLSA